jgi:hypothetical protein
MAGRRQRETFFRPESPVARVSSALPAEIHNGLRLLLAREPGGCCFLPIRPMQYLAVVEREETVFVDASGGYLEQDGEGGRPVRIVWRPAPGPRASIADPVPFEILYYFADLAETQRRLIGETRAALRQAFARGRAAPAPGRRVIALRRP